MRQQTRHQAGIAPATIRAVMNELAIEALDFVPPSRVADTVRPLAATQHRSRIGRDAGSHVC